MGVAAPFIILVVLFFLVAPILGVVAFVRLARLEGRRRSGRNESVVGRVSALERQVSELSRRLQEVLKTTEPEGPPAEHLAAPKSEGTAMAVEPSLCPSLQVPPPSTQATHCPADAVQIKPGAGGLDMETRFAGRWLNWIAIVALLLSVAFFVKFAFDNQWVGPVGRVLILLLIGGLLLWYSHRLLSRGYRYFSEGITGLATGVLYLAVYAAWWFYHLVPQGVAFIAMVAVTAGMLTVAIRRNSQSAAFLAMLGGFLTPALLSTGEDSQRTLFSYLVVLNAGLLVLSRWRTWRALEIVCLVWTIGYFTTWYDQYYTSEKLLVTFFFATAFFTEFGIIPLLQARQGPKLRAAQMVVVLANVTWYMAALDAMLYDHYRGSLTFWLLVLAAIHWSAAWLAAQNERGMTSPTVLLYTGLGLTLITLAVFTQFEGKWVTMAWAIEGTVLVWTGLRIRHYLLRWFGLSLFVLVAIRLWALPIQADRFLANPRFATFVVVAACFAVAFFLAREHHEGEGTLSSDEERFFKAVGLAANVLLLSALSMEIWEAFGRLETTTIEPRLSQQLALSLLWILYSSVHIVLGVQRGSAALRRQGLALIGVVVLKAFLIDISFLERGYRILSFLVLGLVLMFVSFLYQKHFGRHAEQ